jgi:NitT/TauT family transport system permease protein
MPDPVPVRGRVWGGSRAIARHLGLVPWADVTVGFAVAGALLAALYVGREFGKGRQPEPSPVHLGLPYLALYTVYSLARGLVAYVLSLGFAIAYGYWAARDRVAEKVLLPLLDILQSIPVLTFMPGFMLAMTGIFPNSELGLNLAAILLIFTGQVWNMVFSFYHSMKTLPPDFYEAGQIYRFGWWRRFSRIELPFATGGLVWNSMMSMAGGWFFLMVCEAFELGKEHQFRLLGLGSYMSVAQDQGNYAAMAWAVLAMILMIVVMNQLIWRPATVWAQRFKVEDVAAGQTEESLVLDLLRRSRLLWLGHGLLVAPVKKALDAWDLRHAQRAVDPPKSAKELASLPRLALWLPLFGLACVGLYLLVTLLQRVTAAQWLVLSEATCLTLFRVLGAVALGTLWMIPIGVAVGLRPRLAASLQPAIQVAASFPAPMLFSLFLVVFDVLHIDLAWGSVLLMLAGTQWYILFNVLGGTMAIPSDLHEATAIYRWTMWQKWKHLYLPAIFPFLVTGWVTAAGGAWNTSIVAEYWKVAATADNVTEANTMNASSWERALFDGKPPDDPRIRRAFGLGAIINRATVEERYPILAAGALAMAATVVLINRLFWRRLESLAEERFGLSR